MPKIRAHQLKEGDVLKVGGTELIVHRNAPGYCDHNKVSIGMHHASDPVIYTNLLVPRHYKLKVTRKKK